MANNIHAEQIKLVFFDIDETLYVKDKAYVPPSVYTAIRKLKERGIVPGIATGRARGVFPREIDELIEQEDRKSTRLNSSYLKLSRMPSSA